MQKTINQVTGTTYKIPFVTLSICTKLPQILWHSSFFFSVDAVFAMAHALNELYKDVCGSIPYNDCAEMNSASIGPQLLKYILKVSFVGRQGSLVSIFFYS